MDTPEGINHHYPLTLRMITPLHIGGTQEKHFVRGLDFIQDKGKTYFLDLRKICEKISPNEVAQYLSGGRAGQLQNCLDVNRVRYEVVSSKIVEGIDREGDIKAFVKNPIGDLPYVPGSSVKGAIRSIIVGDLNVANISTKDFEAFLLGKFDTDIFRHIKIGDGASEGVVYYSASIFNLRGGREQLYKDQGWRGGWKDGMPLIYECLPPGISLALDLKITRTDTGLMHMIKEADKKEQLKKDQGERNAKTLTRAFVQIILPDPLIPLFARINKKTRQYIEKEIDWLKKYPIYETASIVAEYNRILALIPENDQYAVFRMAHGSGFHSITGDWQYNDFDQTGFHKGGRHDGKKYIKSRKFLKSEGKYLPMGFVLWGMESDLPPIEMKSVARTVVQMPEPTPPPITINPSFHKGTIKDQTELDAVVVSDGLPNKVETYLNEPLTVTIPLNGYASAIPQGKVLRVRVIQMDKSTGKPKMVKFQDFKK